MVIVFVPTEPFNENGLAVKINAANESELIAFYVEHHTVTFYKISGLEKRLQFNKMFEISTFDERYPRL